MAPTSPRAPPRGRRTRPRRGRARRGRRRRRTPDVVPAHRRGRPGPRHGGDRRPARPAVRRRPGRRRGDVGRRGRRRARRRAGRCSPTHRYLGAARRPAGGRGPRRLVGRGLGRARGPPRGTRGGSRSGGRPVGPAVAVEVLLTAPDALEIALDVVEGGRREGDCPICPEADNLPEVHPFPPSADSRPSRRALRSATPRRHWLRTAFLALVCTLALVAVPFALTSPTVQPHIPDAFEPRLRATAAPLSGREAAAPAAESAAPTTDAPATEAPVTGTPTTDAPAAAAPVVPSASPEPAPAPVPTAPTMVEEIVTRTTRARHGPPARPGRLGLRRAAAVARTALLAAENQFEHDPLDGGRGQHERDRDQGERADQREGRRARPVPPRLRRPQPPPTWAAVRDGGERVHLREVICFRTDRTVVPPGDHPRRRPARSPQPGPDP